MKTRLLAFVAFPLAVLSGGVLFGPPGRLGRGWLDVVFLISVLILLILILSAITRLASNSLDQLGDPGDQEGRRL